MEEVDGQKGIGSKEEARRQRKWMVTREEVQEKIKEDMEEINGKKRGGLGEETVNIEKVYKEKKKEGSKEEAEKCKSRKGNKMKKEDRGGREEIGRGVERVETGRR